jgi:hypothetical protein
MHEPGCIFWADQKPCSTLQAGVELHIWRPENAGQENDSYKGARAYTLVFQKAVDLLGPAAAAGNGGIETFLCPRPPGVVKRP